MSIAISDRARPVAATLNTCPEGMVLIPGGPFLMGSAEGGEFERPVHEVQVADFWMDATLVTNAQYARFVEQTGYRTTVEGIGHAWGYANGGYAESPGLCWRTFATPDREDHPVTLVSWQDAEAYARWAGKRLPTEAEWEKVTRGGLIGATYPWGEEKPNGTQCNFARAPLYVPPTTSVKCFPPNSYGVYDMVGNIWQWCADFYAEYYYARSPVHDPRGSEDGVLRVRRGGAWNVIQAFRLRCANRGAMDPSSAAPNIGFRCVASAKKRVDPERD